VHRQGRLDPLAVAVVPRRDLAGVDPQPGDLALGDLLGPRQAGTLVVFDVLYST